MCVNVCLMAVWAVLLAGYVCSLCSLFVAPHGSNRCTCSDRLASLPFVLSLLCACTCIPGLPSCIQRFHVCVYMKTIAALLLLAACYAAAAICAPPFFPQQCLYVFRTSGLIASCPVFRAYFYAIAGVTFSCTMFFLMLAGFAWFRRRD